MGRIAGPSAPRYPCIRVFHFAEQTLRLKNRKLGGSGMTDERSQSAIDVEPSVPMVAIIVNNFNYATFLQKCIESALAQTYPQEEVVVVDDASTDNSSELIHAFGSRIVAVLQEAWKLTSLTASLSTIKCPRRQGDFNSSVLAAND